MFKPIRLSNINEILPLFLLNFHCNKAVSQTKPYFIKLTSHFMRLIFSRLTLFNSLLIFITFHFFKFQNLNLASYKNDNMIFICCVHFHSLWLWKLPPVKLTLFNSRLTLCNSHLTLFNLLYATDISLYSAHVSLYATHILLNSTRVSLYATHISFYLTHISLYSALVSLYSIDILFIADGRANPSNSGLQERTTPSRRRRTRHPPDELAHTQRITPLSP